jgi:hypothetical protein
VSRQMTFAPGPLRPPPTRGLAERRGAQPASTLRRPWPS